MNWSHTLDERMLHQRRTTRKDAVNTAPKAGDNLQLAGFWHRNDEQRTRLRGDEAA